LKIVKRLDAIRDALGFTKNGWQKQVIDPVIKVRDVVMHPVREGGLVSDRGPSLARLVELDERMRSLVNVASSLAI
jgi:hypothetical protein